MKIIAVDTETNSLNAFVAKITHASWCYKDGNAKAINWNNRPQRKILIAMLEDPEWVKIFHNGKYDRRVLHNAGINIRGKSYDTMIMSQMTIDTYRHGLKQLTNLLLKENYNEQVELKRWCRQNKKKMWEAPDEIILPYALKDARCTMGLFIFLWGLIVKRKMRHILEREVELTTKCVIRMESRGIKLDRAHCTKLAKEALKHRDNRSEAMKRMVADPELNPNSFRQMGDYIFCKDIEERRRIYEETGNRLKVAKSKRQTPTGYPTTDNFALRQANTPLARLLIDYRLYKDAFKKYLYGMLKLADSNDIIHADFSQNGARTGRFSCSDPNLTNIPKDSRTFMGKIRKIFIARPGYILLFQDFDQIEIKLAAHFSKQGYMLEAIRDNKDLHGIAATKYFGVKPRDDDFKLMRSVAKTQNYAMLYGAQAYRLHRTLMEEAGIHVSVTVCEGYIDAYWKTNYMIGRLRNNLQDEVSDTGGIRNPYGRFIIIPIGFEYIAINALIQSTAADIIKCKMLECQEILKDSRSYLVLMVHDELIFEIHRSDVHLIPLLKSAMEESSKFSIPITCSTKWGKNWLEKRKVPEKILNPGA